MYPPHMRVTTRLHTPLITPLTRSPAIIRTQAIFYPAGQASFAKQMTPTRFVSEQRKKDLGVEAPLTCPQFQVF